MNAGADAVYAAGARFGARAYANNFTQDELIEAIERAHIYGEEVLSYSKYIIKRS